MEIFFKDNKLAKVLNDGGKMQREYGAKRAKAIRLRLAVLAAASCLADVPVRPPDRCHLLTGRLVGCFAVDVEHPYRLVFEPRDNPPPRTADGGVDQAKVTEVVILDIVDYH